MSLDSVSDWSTTAASNVDVGGINIQGSASIANGDNALREIMEQIASYTRRGSDLASAATLNLDSIDSLFLNVTGTTTVTAVTLTSGHWRIVRATGAFQMTAGASLVVNGSTTVNMTTIAGDYLLFEGYAAGVVRVALIGGSLRGVLPSLGSAFQGLRVNSGATALEYFTTTGAVINSTVGTYATNANLSTTIPLDDTIPQIGEGVEIISVSHTPQTTTNKLRIRFVGEVAGDTSPSVCIAALFINGGANAVRAQHITIPTANYGGTIAFEYEYTPGATSAQTIAVRAGGSTAAATTIRFNGTPVARFFGGTAAAMLTVEEIRA